MQRRLWRVLAMIIVTSLLVSACGGSTAQPAMKLAPESLLPAEMKDQPARVKEAYRFAIANPDLLKQIPCFCGCVAEQHESNYNCYVAEDGGPGSVLDFDNHATGCGICVDITQDVMTMQQEGKSVEEMRAVINQRYGTFGPSTDDADKSSSTGQFMPIADTTQLMSSLPEHHCDEDTGLCDSP
jgi:hypothetical protein